MYCSTAWAGSLTRQMAGTVVGAGTGHAASVPAAATQRAQQVQAGPGWRPSSDDCPGGAMAGKSIACASCTAQRLCRVAWQRRTRQLEGAADSKAGRVIGKEHGAVGRRAWRAPEDGSAFGPTPDCLQAVHCWHHHCEHRRRWLCNRLQLPARHWAARGMQALEHFMWCSAATPSSQVLSPKPNILLATQQDR